jgi:hypothetical protein
MAGKSAKETVEVPRDWLDQTMKEAQLWRDHLRRMGPPGVILGGDFSAHNSEPEA